MNKIIKSLNLAAALFLVHSSIFISQARAVCPVCTAAVITGLGFSRYLGVDDTVSGVWMGGLVLSSSFWMIDWAEKKFKTKSKLKANYKYLTPATIILMYLIVFVPLYWTNSIGHPFNRLWGIDKLVVGAAGGSLAFLTGLFADKKERELKGKILFPFQKVVFPVALLAATSVLLYIITKP